MGRQGSVVVVDPSPNKKENILSIWVDTNQWWWRIPLQTKKKIHLFNMVDKDR
jgi:hypothetical protein